MDGALIAASDDTRASTLSERRWVWREGESRIALALAQRLGLPELVAGLLAGRGIALESAADFLAPTLRALMPDPACLADMDRVVARLVRAVRAGETVGVFGDYDVDGACGSAILAETLRALGCTVHTHIPDRIAEGYGPNLPALQGLVARGASLLLCVDCGTAAGVVLAQMQGAACIAVLDHHKADQVPAGIVGTINPHRPDCGSGLHGLCAAAIAFLTMTALLRALRLDGFFADRAPPDLLGQLDLVALATVCDVMPLTGFNRVLVTQGLKVLAQRRRPGLAALLDIAGARAPYTATTCGFALGPRINAGGRIGDANLGLRLLLTRSEDEAREIAATLDGVNRDRQEVETALLAEAMAQARDQLAEGRAVLLVSGRDWHPGVVGIVAGRIKERFNRPACAAAIGPDGSAKGSGRSVPGFDLGAAVADARAAGLLETGGGHAMAAGFGLDAAALPAFATHLDRALSGARELPTAPDLVVEGALACAAATVELARSIETLAPFGAGHGEPIVVVTRVRVAYAERVGRDQGTLRLAVEGEGGGPRLKAMLFRALDGAPARIAAELERRDGTWWDLAGQLRAESWNGTVSVTLFIVDAAPAGHLDRLLGERASGT